MWEEALEEIDTVAERDSPTTEGDTIRAYLVQIGRVPLLTAPEERALCMQIEEARAGLAAALLAEPSSAKQIAELSAAVRHDTAASDKLLESPDGGVLGHTAVIEAVDRLDRAANLIARFADPLRADRLLRAIAGRLVAVPLRPALIEALAIDAARHGDTEACRRVHCRLEGLRAVKQRLVEANLRLVVSVARRYRFTGVPLLDLVQEGNLGLLKAVDRFQYRRGFKFSTYATWWIRQAVTRSVAISGRTVRLPVHTVEALNRIEASRRTLLTQLGHEPSVEDIAAHLSLSANKVTRLLRSDASLVSLDAPVAATAVLGDLVADTGGSAPDAGLVEEDTLRQVRAALESLNARERRVVELRYGLTNSREYSLDEVAHRLGCTREAARQLERRAMNRLRRRRRWMHPQRAGRLAA